MRDSVLQALTAKRPEDSDIVADLHTLLADLPEVRAPSSRWMNWDVLAGIELNALDAWSRNVGLKSRAWRSQADDKMPVNRPLRQIVCEPNEDLVDLADLASLGDGGEHHVVEASIPG